MRFMIMHKVDAKMEAGEPPPKSIIEGMGKFVGQHLKSGAFTDGAGLHRSATRARVRFADGERAVERGPYAGDNELPAGFVMVTANGLEHAIELATELGRAAGDREIEIGPVVEGWDLTGSPRPANAPYRYLLLRKEPATPAAPPALLDRWKRDGILLSAAGLAPSTTTTAKRSRVRAGTRTWIDGPFAESKELVAGYSIVELPGFAEATAWADEYAAILGDNEVDVRIVA